jgi:mRNA interferase RelE/StbE
MYKIEYSSKAAKEFVKLPMQIQKQIRRKLDILAQDPFANAQVKAMKGDGGAYRLRVGDYRIIYAMENAKLIVTIIRIGHRKDVYE